MALLCSQLMNPGEECAASKAVQVGGCLVSLARLGRLAQDRESGVVGGDGAAQHLLRQRC